MGTESESSPVVKGTARSKETYAKLYLRKRHSSAAIQPASAGGLPILHPHFETPQYSDYNSSGKNVFNFDVLQVNTLVFINKTPTKKVNLCYKQTVKPDRYSYMVPLFGYSKVPLCIL